MGKSLSLAMLSNVRKAIITRINMYLVMNGQFFEYLNNNNKIISKQISVDSFRHLYGIPLP
jgi:hypothetical protein